MADLRPIAWTQDLETGHPEIDAQHKTLIESLNRLRTAITSGHGDKELGSCLSFLKAYARVHFRTEEALLAALPPAVTAEHFDAHQQLLQEVDALFRQFIKGELQVLPETVDMLDRWLIDHIRGTDRDMLRTLLPEP